MNSWTRATPEEAMAILVRTYARKVRSEARWSLATLPEFSSVRDMHDSRLWLCALRGGDSREQALWLETEDEDGCLLPSS